MIEQAIRKSYLSLGWFPEDTLLSITALTTLWRSEDVGVSVTTTIRRVNRLHKLSMLTKVNGSFARLLVPVRLMVNWCMVGYEFAIVNV